MAPDPIRRFVDHLERARAAGGPDATAHVVATASAGQPSARYVLLKGVDERGFVFFTNLGSRKATELAANPRVALCFHWPAIKVEARVQGQVEAVSSEESDAYFGSRPRGSQLGAWASRQSRPLPAKAWLIARWLLYAVRYAGRRVGRPPFWGGFLVRPSAIELLEGQDERIVERRLYVKDADAWREARTRFEYRSRD